MMTGNYLATKEQMEFIWKYGSIENAKRINKWSIHKLEKAYEKALNNKRNKEPIYV